MVFGNRFQELPVTLNLRAPEGVEFLTQLVRSWNANCLRTLGAVCSTGWISRRNQAV